jgi:hypothetical protein
MCQFHINKAVIMGYELVQVSRAAAWVGKNENRLFYCNTTIHEKKDLIYNTKKYIEDLV